MAIIPMGNVNCHCLNARSEAGPILDLAFKTEPSPRKNKAQSKPASSRQSISSDSALGKALQVHLARKSLMAMKYLPRLEGRMGMRLSMQARMQYIRLGPRFTDFTADCHHLKDGSVFLGHLSKSTDPTGPGCLFQPDGSLFEGSWDKSGLEGQVRVIYMNGEYYEGEYHQDQLHGKGTFLSCNGSMYQGSWRSGKRCGKGKETWPDGAVYTGDFEDEFKHGRGVFRWADGSTYEGDFKRNELDGFGHYIWADLKEYTGTWKNNKMHGKGIYRWPDGRRYEGEFKNDVKEGQGVLTWAEGKTYSGSWAANRMHGLGTQSSPGAGSKKGEWSRGKRLRWLE